MAEIKVIARRSDLLRMQADAVLPAVIRPESMNATETPRVALLTGACGFLGRRLVRELLRQTNMTLVCLVRDKKEVTAAIRVAQILTALGISPQEQATRIEVLAGDVAEPRLGLSEAAYADLAGRVDVIYHCAALVDWVRSYGQLYRMNVGGVLAMIQLACQTKLKRVVFVSSIAVCYSWSGPERVDEQTDMLPYIDGMPLGYARSKCVAEALLRQAAARGVPVTVLRPALISGDSVTGESSATDLIAAIMQSGVTSGMAIDTDWQLDCVPVDFIASVMARVAQGTQTFQVLNLMHQHPRHWREVVLWINLHGYPVALVGCDAWIRHLFDEQHARGTMLYAQRKFFSDKKLHAGCTQPTRSYETYLAVGQRRIDTAQTRMLLNQYDLREAPLGTDLLHAYFEHYRKVGLLPSLGHGSDNPMTLDQLLGNKWLSQGHGNIANWAQAERTRIGTDDGLLNEIAAARVSKSVGLWHLRNQYAAGKGQELEHAVLKVKVSDRLIQDLTVQMAGICQPGLGEMYGDYRDSLGLAGSNERELALYELNEPSLRRHMPICYGTYRDPDAERWALLLEYIPEAAPGSKRTCLRANDPGMRVVLNGLAAIHAIWYLRTQDIAAQPWLSGMADPERMGEMEPLWRALANYAAPNFEDWCGRQIRGLQADYIADMHNWWPRLCAMPSTLIHNDFNPRNLVLRQKDGLPRLCAYDWELATIGVPQHDLAELLCFTWQPDMTEHDLNTIVAFHRSALSAASGLAIDVLEWREGFALSLRHLLINRLPMYTLPHRFRTLDYLPRVMANWMQLHTLSRNWAIFSPDETAASRIVDVY